MILSSLYSFGHELSETVGAWKPEEDLESQISAMALRTVAIAAVSLIVLVIVAALVKDRAPRFKLPLFILMTTAMAGSVLTLLVSTVYLNLNSDSGGPIHWHADIEFWACDNQIELRDPTGALSNKIGTAVLHEHDDQRIHLEGVVVEESQDASLGKFMYVVGGGITADSLLIPLNSDPERWFEDDVDGDGPNISNTALVADYITSDADGTFAEFRSGGQCGEEQAEVQTFVYHYDEEHDVYWQEKIAQPQFYTIAKEPNVPPGDCLIVEYGISRDRTSKLCEQYGIRDIDRCEAFGVELDKRAICTIREVGLITKDGEIVELKDLINSEPDQIQPLETPSEPQTLDSTYEPEVHPGDSDA